MDKDKTEELFLVSITDAGSGKTMCRCVAAPLSCGNDVSESEMSLGLLIDNEDVEEPVPDFTEVADFEGTSCGPEDP